MRTVIQRVTRASVTVNDEIIGEIDHGLLILLGIAPDDTEVEAKWLAEKIAVMRIFEDEQSKFNLSLLDVGGGALVVSQFTLYADASYGRRPSFIKAAAPDIAAPLVDRFADLMRAVGVKRVEMGRFGTKMRIDLANDGPTTIVLDRNHA